MLTCKNVVVINDEKGSGYQAIDYNRLYLDFFSTDAVESFGKNNKSKPLEQNGKIWSGTRPAKAITSVIDVDGVNTMVENATAQLVADYGTDSDYKDLSDDIKGKLLLLHAADYGRDLWVRAKIQADNREVKAIDPAKALENSAKAMVAEWKSRGKVISVDDAKVRLLAQQLVEEAEDSGSDLSMKDAIAQVKEQMTAASAA